MRHSTGGQGRIIMRPAYKGCPQAACLFLGTQTELLLFCKKTSKPMISATIKLKCGLPNLAFLEAFSMYRTVLVATLLSFLAGHVGSARAELKLMIAALSASSGASD